MTGISKIEKTAKASQSGKRCAYLFDGSDYRSQVFERITFEKPLHTAGSRHGKCAEASVPLKTHARENFAAASV